MYFVYILYSPSLNKYYIGSSVDIEGRIRRHNSNHKGFTGVSPDWTLKYSETFPSKTAGLKREKQIKNWKSKVMIEKLINSADSLHPDL